MLHCYPLDNFRTVTFDFLFEYGSSTLLVSRVYRLPYFWSASTPNLRTGQPTLLHTSPHRPKDDHRVDTTTVSAWRPKGSISTAPLVLQRGRKWYLKFVLNFCLFVQHISKFVQRSFSWKVKLPAGGWKLSTNYRRHFRDQIRSGGTALRQRLPKEWKITRK